MTLKTNEFECGRCRNVFGTLTLFDRHQAVDYKAAQPVSCIQPERLGMVRDPRGTWQTPEGLLARAERATRMTTLRRKAA